MKSFIEQIRFSSKSDTRQEWPRRLYLLLRIRRAVRNDVGLYRNSDLRFILEAVTDANMYAHIAKLRTTSYNCGGEENDEECLTLISHWEKYTLAMV